MAMYGDYWYTMDCMEFAKRNQMLEMQNRREREDVKEEENAKSE